MSRRELVKNHLYQILKTPGPRGAYEARKVEDGFYVRVDMPGVPPEGVVLVKKTESRTVTFTGKAPKLWPEFDTSERVYEGYVVLDRNPQEVDVEMTVLNGCMRLFFPDADGVLRTVKPKALIRDDFVVDTRGVEEYWDVANLDPEFHNHTYWHINPFLVEGLEGVYDYKDVEDGSNRLKYIMVDMPGIGKENYKVEVVNVKAVGDTLMHQGEGAREHPLDEGGKKYMGGATWSCSCCRICGVIDEMEDGVLRIMFRSAKIDSLETPGKPCFFGLVHVMNK